MRAVAISARDERGVIAVMFALLLVVMLSITALVIDLGNARQQRRVAQASADAAALAGGEAIESGMNTTNGIDPVVDGRHSDQELREGQRQHRDHGVGRLLDPYELGVPSRLRQQQQLHLGDVEFVPGTLGGERRQRTSTTCGCGCRRRR